MSEKRDHGGGLNAAIDQYGGVPTDWIDLSTGINPNPYPIPEIPLKFWHSLPDTQPTQALLNAARALWNIPKDAVIVPASGVSAIIAILPLLKRSRSVSIIGPTYNEFAASFRDHNWDITDTAPAQIRVHPNNPDGRVFTQDEITNAHQSLTVVDESFCDICPDKSLIHLADQPDYIILKGTGKFWGLAGMRLGFAITTPVLAEKLGQLLGPWNISGPAQFIGTQALSDAAWITNTRIDLKNMARNLDAIISQSNLSVLGGTDLFRLAQCDNAVRLHDHLCKHNILTRVFPYSNNWIRFGLPANEHDLYRVQMALGSYA
ncbi:pyridoxal phosphate-dependent class II aminotransferase [Amylibacter sp. SFDW26]|uniref:threonine-phosphate decarboxylase n=1 Tax=Amylibacter sp. SFDW26 TaxID=2652722 RepID=UPI001261FC01|nr:threonine-phosphate decarboxylase [Amylibacter sp. SFDW26]KAB7614740.1 pyridoxal phosphate-dependent class II aminotransferase [Amylibacter sp. SFDW26]